MNRRSFFGFLAAAPVLPLMARGDEMHSGGFVGAHSYLIGEHGPETVMPLDWSMNHRHDDMPGWTMVQFDRADFTAREVIVPYPYGGKIA